MPKPYHTVGNTQIVGPAALRARPALAVNIAYIAAEWEALILALWQIFANLMAPESMVAVKIFMAIEAESPRRSIMGVIARNKLDSENAEKLMKFAEKVREKSQKHRNPIIHGIWAVDSGIDDALILTKSAAHLSDSADFEMQSARYDQTFDSVLLLNRLLTDILPPDQAEKITEQLLQHKRSLFPDFRVAEDEWLIYQQKDFERHLDVIQSLRKECAMITNEISRYVVMSAAAARSALKPHQP